MGGGLKASKGVRSATHQGGKGFDFGPTKRGGQTRGNLELRVFKGRELPKNSSLTLFYD